MIEHSDVLTKRGWVLLWRGGPGIAWKPVSEFMTFSERYGYRRTWCVFGLRWTFLRKRRPWDE